MDRYSSIISKLEKIEDVAAERDVPLSRCTSFRIGGPAALMLFPLTAGALASVWAALGELGESPVIMGNGTNLLFPDGGIARPVINTSRMDSAPELLPGDRLRVPAGLSLAKAAQFAARNALSGMEFAHGIPGTLGGAVSMNAGAYGGEMKDIVESTRCADASGRTVTLTGEEHGFGYRVSAVQKSGLVVLDTVMRLTPGSAAAIQERMEELAKKRRASQPLEYPSAGSVFKRPENGYAAAMIDQAGLKGFSVGGAQVSEKHAGFMINTGGATCADVLELIDRVRSEVFERTGTLLETEIKVIV